MGGVGAATAAFALLLGEFGLAPAIAVALDDEDLDVVGQTVDEGEAQEALGKTVSQSLKGRLVVMSRERCS